MITEKNKKGIAKLDELSLFFLINQCSAYVTKLAAGIANGTIKDIKGISTTDMNNVKETQDYAVSQLLKFGVDPTSAKLKDGDYWKWYKFWDKWSKTLSQGEYEMISQKLAKNKSIKDHLPKEKWND